MTFKSLLSERVMKEGLWTNSPNGRRGFIGGSDARIIMGSDEAALVRIWREKRGEVGPEDLSGNLIVQLGSATEDLNRVWYERNTGYRITDVQRHVKHSAIPWMAATLDGIVEQSAAVFEAKFMLPWSFSEVAAAEKYMAQSSSPTTSAWSPRWPSASWSCTQGARSRRDRLT
jgi:predicted phage-related endonuclease